MTCIQLVCFDIGGVMLRLWSGWSDACACANVPLPANVCHPATLAQIRTIVLRSETGQIDPQQFADEMACLTGLTCQQMFAVSNAWLRGPFPGIDQLLDALVPRPVATACLSNTNANHWRAMSTPGSPNHLALHKLTHRFASQLLQLAKPDPDIYRHVEEATGVAAEQILFFDDSQENIDAAANCSWNAVRIDPHANPVAQMTVELQRYRVL